MDKPRILLLDFDPANGLRDTLRNILECCSRLNADINQEYFEPAFYKDKLTQVIACANPSLIFIISSPSLIKQSGEILQCIRELTDSHIIIIIESCEPDVIFELLKTRGVDFITPALKPFDILPRVWRILEQSRSKELPIKALKEKFGFKRIIGESPVFLAELEKIPLVADCDASVLISGETGTGKELFARAIHYLSPRASRPFVSVNCGAIPLELMENELFGHHRGAFTGATTSHLGVIHEGDEGTLFLDEIDCLPLLAQVKLLRFLQDKEYRPLGSSKICKADVRIIAASNVDFEEAVRSGKLRRDLYYRLNVIPLRLPPLRERREDIPLLVRHLLAKYTKELRKEVSGVSPEALKVMIMHDWPGNVRELEHVIQRAVVLCRSNVIQSNHIILPHKETNASDKPFQELKAEVIARFEKNYLQGLLHAYQGNISQAAQAAQKDRRALWHLIQKYDIDVKSFRLKSSAAKSFVSATSH